MGWSAEQQKRLTLEKGLLENYFRGRVQWIDQTMRGNSKVDVQMTTSTNKNYTLRMRIPEDFPNSCPVLVVNNPARPLKLANGCEMSASTANHSWGTNDGRTQICHFVPGQWSSENTLYQVFMKGLIWLEAYEGHLASGKPISRYLAEMPFA